MLARFLPISSGSLSVSGSNPLYLFAWLRPSRAAGAPEAPKWRACLWVSLLFLTAAGCSSFPQTSAQREAESDTTYARALAHYSEGLLLESQSGPNAKARQAFEAAYRLDPDSRHPLDALVMRLLQEGRTREALDHLETYCREHPRNAAARSDLARLAELNDDPRRAARHYAEAFRLQPDDLKLAFSQVRALFASARDPEALQTMRTLNQTHPCIDTRNLPTFWAIHFFRRVHAAQRALPCLELASEIATGATQRVELRFFYGEAAQAAGHTNEAVRAFQQTLVSNPMHLRAVLSLAHLLYIRDGASAIATQAQQTRKTPDDLPGVLTLAALYLAAQDRTNAAPMLARAHDLMLAQKKPPGIDYYLLQSSTLDELGRQTEAASVLTEGLQQHPQADTLMNYLAYMWAVANVHLEEAAHWAQQAVKRQPKNGAYLDTFGWVRYRQQRLEEALNLLLRAREHMPDDPTVLEHVGDVLARLQRTPEAAAYWSRSYAIDPAQPAVAEKLRAVGVNPATIPRLVPTPEEESDSETDAE